MVRLKRGALSDQVVDEIGSWILTGKVQPGEILPSEQTLSEQFGVSKTVIREAGKILASKGLVTIRQGIGTTANPQDQWQPFDPLVILHAEHGTSFDDLVRVRQILEPEVAAMACVRSGDQAFLDMLADLIEKGGRVTNVEDHVHFDLAFHQALAEATGNQLLVIMMNSIGQFLRASREALFEVPGAVERSSFHHRQIFGAISQGDTEASREAMKRHLLQVLDDSCELVSIRKGLGDDY